VARGAKASSPPSRTTASTRRPLDRSIASSRVFNAASASGFEQVFFICSLCARPQERSSVAATITRLSGTGDVLEGRMGFNSIRRGVLAAFMASFLALFVLVPAVDAMSCGTEGEPSEAVVLVVDDHSSTPHSDNPSHGVCSHGHCHHGGVSTPARQDASLDRVVGRGALTTRPAHQLISHPPAGPKRPPRG